MPFKLKKYRFGSVFKEEIYPTRERAEKEQKLFTDFYSDNDQTNKKIKATISVVK